MAQYTRFSTYIGPLVKTPKSQAYTMLLLSLMSVIFFGIFAIRPTVLTIVSLERQITDAQDVDKKLSEKIKALDLAQQVLDRIHPKQSLLSDAMPDTPNVTTVLKMLELKASQTKVSLGGVQFHALALSGEEARAFVATGSASAPTVTSTPSPNNSTTFNTQKIDLSFTATGAQSDLANFLHQLTLPRRLFVVTGLNLTQIKNVGYAIDVTAQTYTTSADASGGVATASGTIGQ